MSFDLSSSACLNEAVHIANNSLNIGAQVDWDFCGGDLKQVPSGTVVRQVLEAVGPSGVSVAKEGDNYFLFMVGRTGNNIVRLSLGIDPANPVAKVKNLGNPAGTLKGPVGLTIVKEHNSWYGLTYNSQSDSLVRISFGPSLSNPAPVVEQVSKAYGSNNVSSGLALGSSAGRAVVAVTNPLTNKVTLIDFGNSLANNPVNLLTTSSITGANFLGGITLMQLCGKWFGFAVAASSRRIFRLEFGTDLFSQPSVFDITNNFATTDSFRDIQIVADGGEFYGFLLTSQGSIYRAEFGETITSLPQIENLGNFGTIASTTHFDFVKHGSNWSFFTANTGTRFLYRADFPDECSALNEIDTQFQPDANAYTEPGTYKVTLEALHPEDGYAYVTGQILIEDKPAPQIAFEQTGICAGNNSRFVITSDTDLESADWDFGDGQSSFGLDVSHSYTTDGEYVVTALVTSTNQCTNSRQETIDIYSQPVADFDLPSGLLCTNSQFSLIAATPDNYDENLSYEWSVDNEVVGTDRGLELTFQMTGIKQIKLRVAIPGCSNELTKITPAIESGPEVDYSFTGICEDESFSFQSDITEAVESFAWDFGNGDTSANPNPEYSFTEAGEYAVSLAATSAIGCATVSTKPVTVRSRPLVDFLFQEAPNGCSGTETLFENQTFNPDGRPITQWLWNFNDPNNATPGTTMEGQHVFAEAGDYNVSLTATTADGCAASTAFPITILPSPSTAFTHSPACEDLPVSFALAGVDLASSYWEIGTSYYLESSPSHTFPVPGDYPLYLEVVGINGCISTVNHTIHVPVPLTPNFSVDNSCVDETAVFTDLTSGADPVTARLWEFDDGETFTEPPISHVFTQAGPADVTLTVTTQSGCSYEIIRAIDVAEPPIAQFSASPSSGAYPLEVSFANTSSGASESHWEFGDGSSSEDSPAHTFTGQGTYTVTLTVSNEQGCDDSFSDVITTVAPLPDVDIELINITTNPDGSAKLIVTIHNKGNTVLKELPLEINFDGTLELRQVVPEVILPFTKYNFILNSAIVDVSRLRFICVTLDMASDLSPAGNQMCKQFTDKTLILPAFPNPAKATLNIEWIAQEVKPMTITLTDRLGRRIFHTSPESLAGINYYQMDLSLLETGIYILTIDDGTTKSSQRIVLMGSP